jgi:hypothetical protein
MSLGPYRNGRHWPITSTDGAWATTVNQTGIPERVKWQHAETHTPWTLHALTLPGRYDRFGNRLPERAPGSWT